MIVHVQLESPNAIIMTAFLVDYQVMLDGIITSNERYGENDD